MACDRVHFSKKPHGDNTSFKGAVIVKKPYFNPKPILAAAESSGQFRYGLVAEDVAKVNSNLVICEREGRPYTVHYDAVNAMLLNEFLKGTARTRNRKRQSQNCKSKLQR